MADDCTEKSPLIKSNRNNTLHDSDEDISSCGASVCCDPKRNVHRYFVLGLICFLSFGSYYCYDNPAALENIIKQDMGVKTDKYVMLYSLYSYPNVILCFFGGFLLDRVFGVRLGTIIFSLFVLVGQVIFALGAYYHSFLHGDRKICIWFRRRKFGCCTKYLLSELVQGKRVKYGVRSSVKFLKSG